MAPCGWARMPKPSRISRQGRGAGPNRPSTCGPHRAHTLASAQRNAARQPGGPLAALIRRQCRGASGRRKRPSMPRKLGGASGIYLWIITLGGGDGAAGTNSGKIKRPNKVQPLEEVSLVNGISLR
jgi:hypothetical protein